MGKTVAKSPLLLSVDGEPLHLIEIDRLIASGMRKADIARQLGIHQSTLDQIRKQQRNPTDKVLKALGLRKMTHVAYFSGVEPRRLEPFKFPEPPKPRELRPIPVLTASFVAIAIRHGLNPARTWDEFTKRANLDSDIASSWQAWCAERGKPSASRDSTKQRIFAPLGQGDAVELKVPAPREDFRGQAIVPGQSSGLTFSNFTPTAHSDLQPQVSADALRLAESSGKAE